MIGLVKSARNFKGQPSAYQSWRIYNSFFAYKEQKNVTEGGKKGGVTERKALARINQKNDETRLDSGSAK